MNVCPEALVYVAGIDLVATILIIACIAYLLHPREAPSHSRASANPYTFERNLCNKKKCKNLHHIDPYVDMLIRLSMETARRMTESTDSEGDELLREISYCTRKEIKLFNTTMMGCTGHSPIRAVVELTVSKIDLFEQIRRACSAEEARQLYLHVVEINKTVKTLCVV